MPQRSQRAPRPPPTCAAPQAPQKIGVALLRGTTADLDGNVSFEREALYLDQARAHLPSFGVIYLLSE